MNAATSASSTVGDRQGHREHCFKSAAAKDDPEVLILLTEKAEARCAARRETRASETAPRSVDLDIPAPERAAHCGPTRDGNAECVFGAGLAVVGHRDGEGARHAVAGARPAE